MFSELECVRLTKDIPEKGLVKGMVGAIVYVWSPNQDLYEVEFPNCSGIEDSTSTTIEGNYLEKVES